MSKSKVKYCPKCSGIKKKQLKEAGVDMGAVSTGCIGDCIKKHPELEGKAYAKVAGKLVVCDSGKKLAKKLAKALEG